MISVYLVARSVNRVVSEGVRDGVEDPRVGVQSSESRVSGEGFVHVLDTRVAATIFHVAVHPAETRKALAGSVAHTASVARAGVLHRTFGAAAQSVPAFRARVRSWLSRVSS